MADTGVLDKTGVEQGFDAQAQYPGAESFPGLVDLIERSDRRRGGSNLLAATAIQSFLSSPDSRADDIHEQAGRTAREDGSLFNDPFDWSRIIRASGNRLGTDRIDYMFRQRATKITESWGAFNNKLRLKFVDSRLLEFGDETARRNRVRTVFTTLRQYGEDKRYRFNVLRALYEHQIKLDEEEMMRVAPIGTARIIVSPCEKSPHGKRIGMFPERDMAVVQISHKESDGVMALHIFSLDRAELPVLRQMLAEQGVEVPAGTLPEDYLGYVINKHFSGEQEVEAFKESFICRFDEIIAKSDRTLKSRPRQGVVKEDARNLHSTAEDVMETVEGQRALWQLYELDARLARHVEEPAPLDPQVRKLAEQCLQAKRSDGSRLLEAGDWQAVYNMLCADKVSIYNEQQALALELVMYIHSTAVEESLRKALTGDKHALDWIVRGQLVVGNGAILAVAVGTKAIEAGRGSGGCGGGTEIRAGLPDYRINPDGYLIAIFGRNSLHRSKCDGCGRTNRLVAKCKPTYCGGCYGRRMANSKRGKLALAA